MIVKSKGGKTFGGCVNYVLNEEKANLLDSNLIVGENAYLIAQQMIRVSELNKRCAQPVSHFSLSFSKEELVNSRIMNSIAKDFLKEMGYKEDNNQSIIAEHTDTEHQHVHIVANRVGFDGSILDNKYSKSKAVKVAKKLEKKYSILVAVQPAEGIKNSKIAKPERERMAVDLRKAIANSTTIDEFISNCSKFNIEAKPNIASTGKISGFSFQYENSKIKHKASQISNEFKWSSLSAQLDANLSHKQTIVNSVVSEPEKIEKPLKTAEKSIDDILKERDEAEARRSQQIRIEREQAERLAKVAQEQKPIIEEPKKTISFIDKVRNATTNKDYNEIVNKLKSNYNTLFTPEQKSKYPTFKSYLYAIEPLLKKNGLGEKFMKLVLANKRLSRGLGIG